MSSFSTVRDRFGIKPMCYYHDEKQLLIASQAKALFPLGIVPAWDQYSYFHSTSLQYLPYDRTLFAGIHQLPPGCMLISENGNLKIMRYWDIPSPVSEPIDLEKTTRTIGEKLQEAVKIRLNSSARLCFHLSGGLDCIFHMERVYP